MRFCQKCGSLFAPNGGEALVCNGCGEKLELTPEVRSGYTVMERVEKSAKEVPVLERWTKVRVPRVEVELSQEALQEIFGEAGY